MNDAVVTLVELILNLHDRVRSAQAEIARLKKETEDHKCPGQP